jgi:hypothetical protein
MDELFASGIKLAYPEGHKFIFEIGDEMEASKVKRNNLNCPLFKVCMDWAKDQKNVSVLLTDTDAEMRYANGDFFGENSEPLLCRLEDGVVYTSDLTMIMFHADPLLRRFSEIIDRVIEAGLYNNWISRNKNKQKLLARKIAIVNPLDGYYSFTLYHMQPAFYLLLIGFGLSTLTFLVEVLCNCILRSTLRSC